MQRDQDVQPGRRGWMRWRWLAVFGVGLALWVAAALTIELTQNPN